VFLKSKLHIEVETPAHLFIAALFREGVQARCLSTRGWIKKTQYTYTVEYHAAIEKNEIMSFAEKWVELG
jgi:hypothetical protein